MGNDGNCRCGLGVFFPPLVCVLLVFYNEHGTLIKKKSNILEGVSLLREKDKSHDAVSCTIVILMVTHKMGLCPRLPNILCYNE